MNPTRLYHAGLKTHAAQTGSSEWHIHAPHSDGHSLTDATPPWHDQHRP